MERSPESAVARFETAVEAVIDGDLATLSALLRDDPDLIRARSTLVTDGDPPVHGATLLHYLAANGVEGHRQRSPKNAVDVAKVLLEAGADPNALSWAYGGQCTTMALLVSSTPPAEAGVQARWRRPLDVADRNRARLRQARGRGGAGAPGRADHLAGGRGGSRPHR
jgi:hypothetical protein